MRRTLRLLSTLLVLSALGWWTAAGARVGWWQTRVGIERTDEITGLSVIEWEDRFVPGIETPLLGLAFGAAGYAATFLFRRKATATTHPKTT